MSLKEAIKTLEDHQNWRMGGNGEPTDPKKLTEAIGMVLFAARQYLLQ
jgi:hypothetical protein